MLKANQQSSSLMSSSSMMSGTDVWSELLDNQQLLESQYDVLAGHWPTKYNEVVLIADKNNEVSDYTLYSLGIKDVSDFGNAMEKLMNNEKIEINDDKNSYTYDELLNYSFKVLLNTDYYKKIDNTWVNMINDQEFMKEAVQNAEEIKIVGIIRPNDNTVASSDAGLIGYTKDLKEYVINKTNESEVDKTIVKTIDLDNPSSINIYPKDFDSKDKIADIITDYNNKQTEDGKEENVINYTDLVGIMMKSVSTIINVISYVLIAFVGISLVVSSIMIGIITYISVLERTKEIGILRSIGASKKDVSRVFNAETLLVGLVAGLMGIGVTLLLNIPINMVIKNLVGISGIAQLPWVGGIILVVISVCLTMIAGLIPAKYAAKRDPVEALRTE